ncbi:hypothetical protein Tco_0962141, partial [Tanacetum coccineum]
MKVVKQVDLKKQVVEYDNELESDTEDVLSEVEDPVAVTEEVTVEGTYFDTLDEAIDMYTSYTEMGGFEVKKSGQRKTKSGVVKHKYIMCNKERIPKGTTRCLFHLLAPIIIETGYCNEKTNEYTKTTCPKNPKAMRKKKV